MQITGTYINPHTGRKEKRSIPVPPGASEAKVKMTFIWAVRFVLGDEVKVNFEK